MGVCEHNILSQFAGIKAGNICDWLQNFIKGILHINWIFVQTVNGLQSIGFLLMYVYSTYSVTLGRELIDNFY